MRLTKMGHACVRVEKSGSTIVIDPGSFSYVDAALGADALLITHEHFDHFDQGRVRRAADANPGLEIWTNRKVAEQLGTIGAAIHVVGHGDRVVVAGFDVTVHGEYHAVIHPDIPVVSNVGFLLDGELFHPGDAFTLPEAPVSNLLLPTDAPWLKLSEAIDFVRAVGPRHAYSLHDGLMNNSGLEVVDRLLGGQTGPATTFHRLASDEPVELDAAN